MPFQRDDDDNGHNDRMSAAEDLKTLQWLMQATAPWATAGNSDQKLARARIEQMHAWAIKRLGN